MPNYDYTCKGCGLRAIDVLRPVKDRDAEKLCPSCGCDMARDLASPGFAISIEGTRVSSSKPSSYK